MNRKISALFLAIIVMLLTMAGSASAQVNYDVTNNSTVSVNVNMGGLCPGLILWTSAKLIAPGLTHTFVIPAAGCTWSVSVNGVAYSLGYNGPIAPPNPPTSIIVNATNAIIQ